jgi:hypothetical protein
MTTDHAIRPAAAAALDPEVWEIDLAADPDYAVWCDEHRDAWIAALEADAAE